MSQPSYYFGNSIIRLFVFKVVQTLLFFRRRGPSRSLLEPLRVSKGSKRGCVALVLGNGPSLNKIDTSEVLLLKPDIFVSNGYYLNSVSKLLSPSYYCLSDPAFFFDNGGVSHSINNTFNYIEESGCTLLISHLYRKQKIHVKNPVIYFNDRELSTLSRGINPCRPRGYASQTVMKSLAVAIFLGYEKIFILGIDNSECRSLIGDSSNKLWVKADKHYAASTEKLLDYEIFTPSGADAVFAQYAAWFADFKKFSHAKVFNLDLDSLIDAFPKVKNMRNEV